MNKMSCLINAVSIVLEKHNKFPKDETIEIRMKSAGYQGGMVDGEILMAVLTSFGMSYSYTSSIYIPCTYILTNGTSWTAFSTGRNKDDSKWKMTMHSSPASTLSMKDMNVMLDGKWEGFIVYGNCNK